MRIAVMGAGAVGSHLGGRLARAGHEVTLVARPRHVEAVAARGLRLESTAEGTDEHIALQATDDVTAVAGAEAVLVTVKSTATAETGRLLTSHLSPGSVVLSVQNGLGNADVLAEAIGREDLTVAPSVVYVAVAMPGDGYVRHVGGGRLLLGADPTLDPLATALADAIVVERRPDVVAEAWGKVTANCAWNALSALTGLSYGQIHERPEMRPVLDDVIAECLAVAAAEGVDLPTAREDTLALVRTMPGQLSSTWQDLDAGRRTEIDHLNGEVVRRGRAHGVATPVNQALLALVRAREDALGVPQTP